MSLVPSPEFQVEQYKKRDWVQYVLDGCADKQKAFDNWMKRDMLFAKRVIEDCKGNKNYCVVNDGEIPINNLVRKVETCFLLNDTNNVKK